MSPETAKVSIVLPTYNGSKYLRRSLESSLAQTHKNFELIVVDDCSTDSTPDILREFTDPRLKVVRNEKNRRLPNSLNRGFSLTTGEYLTWTSDDNMYTPDAIERMLAHLLKTGADFVYADYWEMDEESGRNERVFLPYPPDLKNQCDIRASFLYTRRVYKEIGDYNPNLEIVEDYDYWMRVSKKFKIAHLAEPVYYYQYHPQSLTTRRAHEQSFLTVFLKYWNGYLPMRKAGWSAAYYVQNILTSQRTPAEKRAAIVSMARKFLRLSLPMCLVFFPLTAYYFMKVRLQGGRS